MDYTGRIFCQERLMRILVIDDELIILTAVQRVFENKGFEVVSLNSGAGSFETIAEFKPDFVFLDVKMPGDSGIDLLSGIKRDYPDIKVVMMSGYTSAETLEEAKRFGADAFIKKPFDNIFDLVKIVDSLNNKML